MKENKLPAICSSQQVQTREQFHLAVQHVNTFAKRTDLTVAEAKDTFTKAEALKAWAQFDRRLTDKDKADANRAVTRIVWVMGQLAAKEQPVKQTGRGSLPGPTAWLARELRWSYTKAAMGRYLALHEELYRQLLEDGTNWATGAARAQSGGKPGNRSDTVPLASMARFARVTNTLRHASSLPDNAVTQALSRIRKIKAWCEAYEAALIQRKAKLGK